MHRIFTSRHERNVQKVKMMLLLICFVGTFIILLSDTSKVRTLLQVSKNTNLLAMSRISTFSFCPCTLCSNISSLCTGDMDKSKDGKPKGFCSRGSSACKCPGPVPVHGCQCWHGLRHKNRYHCHASTCSRLLLGLLVPGLRFIHHAFTMHMKLRVCKTSSTNPFKVT